MHNKRPAPDYRRLAFLCMVAFALYAVTACAIQSRAQSPPPDVDVKKQSDFESRIRGMDLIELLVLIISGSTAAGGVVGALLLQWAKARYVTKAEFYDDHGQPLYQSRGDYIRKPEIYYDDNQSIYMHRTLCSQLHESRNVEIKATTTAIRRDLLKIRQALYQMEKRREAAKETQQKKFLELDRRVDSVKGDIQTIVSQCSIYHGSENINRLAEIISVRLSKDRKENET